MSFYKKELDAIRRSGRYRMRVVYNEDFIDLASNDYLNLSCDKTLHQKASDMILEYKYHSPRASMLVNGYHHLHKEFEDEVAEANGFESAIIMGSGFNANIALIESLVRKGDLLLIDEDYHASGVLASKLCDGEVTFFSHNNADELERLLKNSHHKRVIIAVEGIYSMGGDILDIKIIELATKYSAIVILDEAHSSGVIGDRLLGILDYYSITPTPYMIKMGTLGKAYGSFGAYILSSLHIGEFLINRGKSIIYATAPSLYDSALAIVSFRYIQSHLDELKSEIKRKQCIIKEYLGIDMAGLIAPIEIGSNERVLEIQKALLEDGVIVGAIREPTVKRAIIRLIARVGVDDNVLIEIAKKIKNG